MQHASISSQNAKCLLLWHNKQWRLPLALSAPKPRGDACSLNCGFWEWRRQGDCRLAVTVDAAALPAESHFCSCRWKKCPAVRICALCQHTKPLTLKLFAFMYVRYLATYVLAEMMYRPLLFLDATDVSVLVGFALFFEWHWGMGSSTRALLPPSPTAEN